MLVLATESNLKNQGPSAELIGSGSKASPLAPAPQPVTVSMDVVWQGSASKQDARMSEISMEGCYIDDRVLGRSIGDVVAFKVHLAAGPWVALQGHLVEMDYPMGFGLKFCELTDGDKRLLEQVVIAHGGKPSNFAPSPDAPSAEPARDTTSLLNQQPANAHGPFSTPLPEAGEPKDARRRVLVADDDSLTLRMVSAIVESEGYVVIAASDGREALRYLKEEPHLAAAIFDMSMPYLKGLDLILHMKGDERLRRIPVGMITAERDPKVWDDSVAAGVSVFLPKPFTPPQVAMMLRMMQSKAGDF